MSSDLLNLKVGGLTLCMRLLRKENLELVDKVLEQVDLDGEMKSPLGHVVISGDGIWMPTKILYLGKGNMVPRTPGTVYFYALGKTICLTYGRKITESSNINKFREVFAEDLPKLEALGKLVYDKTIQSAQRELIIMKVRRFGQASLGLRPAEDIKVPEFKGLWQDAIAIINVEVGRIWTKMPTDIKKIDLGISNTGSGIRKQMFSVQVHLEAYTMMTGADIVYHFLQDNQDEEMTLSLFKSMTTHHLFKPFNIPELMTDLGLEKMHKIGDMYVKALETVKTFEEYVQLTDVLLNYITRNHLWVHYIFPWHLGTAFPHRNPNEIKMLAKILAAQAPPSSAFTPHSYRN